MTDSREQVGQLSVMLELPQHLRIQVESAFLTVASHRSVAAGDILFTQDDANPDEGCVLLSGGVEVISRGGFSTIVEAPALLGEMRQFHIDQMPGRTANVRALDNLSVLRFDWASFYEALARLASKDDVQVVRAALQRQAWLHYLENVDEL